MPNNAALEHVEHLAESGDLEAAARRVADVEVRGPRDAWRLGQVLELALERPAEAEPLYRPAVEAVPEAIVDLTLLLDSEGRAAEADELLRALPGEDEAGWRVKRGRAYRAEGEIERALAEYARGVELKDPAALRYLAGTLSYEGAVEEARRCYTDPPFGADDPALVDFLQDLGERDAAVKELTLLRERRVPDAERILGDILSEEDEVDVAVAHYLAAVGAGDAKALTNLGVTWREEGRLAEAELALRRSWRDGDVLAGRALGRVLAQTGRDGEAREIWRRAAVAGDDPSGALLESEDVPKTPDGLRSRCSRRATRRGPVSRRRSSMPWGHLRVGRAFGSPISTRRRSRICCPCKILRLRSHATSPSSGGADPMLTPTQPWQHSVAREAAIASLHLWERFNRW